MPNGGCEITLNILGKQVHTEVKRLVNKGAGAIQNNIKGVTEQAGNGGVSIIDGTGYGTTLDDFMKGFNSFLRTSVPKRKADGAAGITGTIMFLSGKETHVINF